MQPARPPEEANGREGQLREPAEERKGRTGPLQGGRNVFPKTAAFSRPTPPSPPRAGSPAQHRAGEHEAERRATDAESGGAEPGGDHRSVPGGAGEAAGLRGPAGQLGKRAAGEQGRKGGVQRGPSPGPSRSSRISFRVKLNAPGLFSRLSGRAGARARAAPSGGGAAPGVQAAGEPAGLGAPRLGHHPRPHHDRAVLRPRGGRQAPGQPSRRPGRVPAHGEPARPHEEHRREGGGRLLTPPPPLRIRSDVTAASLAGRRERRGDGVLLLGGVKGRS